MALARYVSHAVTPVKWPLPVALATYSSSPPADGYRAPSFANEYPCNPATIPASRNDSHTAAPATAPAAPSSEKIPAPTIAPTPMNAACRTLRCVPEGCSAEPGTCPVVSIRSVITAPEALPRPTARADLLEHPAAVPVSRHPDRVAVCGFSAAAQRRRAHRGGRGRPDRA